MDILLTAIISGLLEAILHWFPWRAALGRELNRVLAYAMGTLAMLAPFAIWLALNTELRVLAALLVTVGASGATVMAGYAIDTYLAHQNEVELLKLENKVLRNDQDDTGA